MVWHLLGNAIKFTPRGGTVGLTVGSRTSHASLTVSDSGPGIDPDFLPRIFDRFTQEDPSPTRTAGGLGVGLSLVRDLVELHGGEIRARNNDAGSGAMFTARFPLQPGGSGGAAAMPARRACRVQLAAARRPARAGARSGCRRPRAAADRAAATRRVVRTAASVADALESLEAWRPDVLVSDSVTPEHDSYALVGKVQSLEADRGGRIPAAALTAFARTDERVRRMLEAFNAICRSPSSPPCSPRRSPG